MQNRRNYYRILHIQPDAPDAIIKASYRTQMQKLRMHPDLGGDEWNASLLNEAYRVLSDPQLRRDYDSAYSAEHARHRAPAQPRPEHEHTRQAGGRYDASDAADPSVCPFCRTARPAVSAYAGPGNCPGCDAPLEFANNLRLATTSKRTIERIAQRAPVTMFPAADAEAHPGSMRDLSPNGMQLQCGLPLAENQVVRIVCATLVATGRVIFCNRDMTGTGFIAGIEFITLRFSERSGTFLSVSA